jgi:hypothetical protein
MKFASRRTRASIILTVSALGCFAIALSIKPGLIHRLASPTASAQTVRPAPEVRLSPGTLQQIRSLIAEKRSRTRTQRKISSQLLYAAKMQRGLRITPFIETLEVPVEVSSDGMTTVDITARVTGNLVERIEELGGRVLNAFPQSNSLRARLPVVQLETIAALEEVRFIQPKQVAFTTSGPGRTTGERVAEERQDSSPHPTFNERAARVREQISGALSRAATTGAQDFPSSEGDVVHGAGQARQTFGFNGSGVKIGVLSDGVSNLRVSQTKGALGAVTVLTGQTGEGDEGTAMLEIIHAVAPAAKLFFATAIESPAGFTQNIRELRRLGCDIIVDDIFYLTESPFQDGQATNVISPTNGGLIAQAVNEVTASGGLYFTSAGNSGNLTKGTSGIWEGSFKNGGTARAPLPIDAGEVHDFGTNQLSNQITAATPFSVVLQWSDPLGASANDYDLYVVNSTGTQLLAASVDVQDGTQDPIEIVNPQAAGRRLVVAKYAGEDRFLHLNTNRGRLAIGTNGQTHGHGAGAEAFSVAASPAFFGFGPSPNPIGPFPNLFSSTSRVELFTSDGPRRLFYRADGTPFTPGNLLATGGVLRQKPDITAADGVSVTGVGFFGSPFFGTSAAAPHAAAIAALIKSANPAFTPSQLRQALISSAIDIESPGVDVISGAGIVMPVNSATTLGITPMASLDIADLTVTEVGGNGNGVIEAGERARVSIELKNSGVVNATDVTAIPTSLTPGVFIHPAGVASYGNIAAGASATVNTFEFTLSTVSSCDLRAALTLTLNYTGGPNPKALAFEVQTGPPPVEITSTLDPAAPPSGATYTAATGIQAGRMTRTIVAGTCGQPTTFPGVFSTTPRRYDAYTFSSCPTSAPACVTVSLSSLCSGAQGVFASVYFDSFDPNNIGLNYIGDIGDAPFPNEELNLSFLLPRGRNFVVVVHELNPNGSSGCQYSIRVSGLCQSCATSNLVCVQDERSDDSLLFNFLTGDYLFTRCADGSTFSGRGTVGRAMGQVTLTDGPRVAASVEKQSIGNSSGGTARIRPGGIGSLFLINDRNILNNSCSCQQ